MTIIEIEKLPNGAHRNQTPSVKISVPEGWAVLPDDMETTNFPFGDIETEVIDGVMTVTSWTPGKIPEPEPQPEPTTLDDRVTAIENAIERGLAL